MCGIVGYTGADAAKGILVDGLKRLEYRGYDSSGVALEVSEGGTTRLDVTRRVGKVAGLESELANLDDASTCGIGHTRWATHGRPSVANAHPHVSCDGRIAVVHNGIIENYAPLRKLLLEKGYTFTSETDTEVAAKLIDLRYRECGDHLSALSAVMREMVGSYAMAVLFADAPDRLYALKNAVPLIVGVGEGENFIASDIAAVLRHTKNYYPLGDLQMAVVTAHSIEIMDIDKRPLHPEMMTADWSVEAAERGGYPHFMLKEINEEPAAVEKTLHPRIAGMLPDFEGEHLSDERLRRAKSVTFVACGTAMHAGLVGKAAIERLCRIPVKVEIASEFRYNDPILTPDDLVIIISQSGETADSLAALRLAKSRGAYTLGIVNVIGSSIAREADNVIYTWAGPEISVASTKAYTVQISLIYLLSIRMALLCGRLNEAEARAYTEKLYCDMPRVIEETLKTEDTIKAAAADFANYEDLFFIGRGIDYFLSMEGSLKLKEISYIHSEAYAAGELKHGTISLIEDGTLVIALATDARLFDKMMSNIKEVKARGAVVLGVATEDKKEIAGQTDMVFYIPKTASFMLPSLSVIPMQLFAYYVASMKGCDIDKPRNLAKSVTVE